MQRVIVVVCAVMVSVVSISCVSVAVPDPQTPTDPQLAAAADALLVAADGCYSSVSAGQSWEESRNCAALQPLATSYIAAGGFQDEPAAVALIGERARRTAWQARALECGGSRTIW